MQSEAIERGVFGWKIKCPSFSISHDRCIHLVSYQVGYLFDCPYCRCRKYEKESQFLLFRLVFVFTQGVSTVGLSNQVNALSLYTISAGYKRERETFRSFANHSHSVSPTLQIHYCSEATTAFLFRSCPPSSSTSHCRYSNSRKCG